MFPRRRTRRVFSGSVAGAAAAVLLAAGTAWACPPDPGASQTATTGAAQAAGEGRDLNSHAGHGAGEVGKTSTRVSDAVKGVERVGNVPDAKEGTSLVFMDYGKGRHKRTIMFISGRFGLKAYDVSADPRSPKLVGSFDLPGFWQGEDSEADHKRKIFYLSRDPRAFGGTTNTGESGVYVVDVSKPESLKQIAYQVLPAGHTTSCINDCQYLWTGGPAKADWQPADWGGRPVWVTDVRNPRKPKVFKDPIDTGRNDGKTDYTHDIQVDSSGIAWASGRGGVRGYHTSGWHYDPVLKKVRKAVPWNPVPYAGGGLDEATVNSSFMHNSFRPVGRTADQGPDPRKWGRGQTLVITEETFNDGCAADGLLVIASLKGSYGGQGWRSTPDNKFRLRTLGTWGVAGKEGSRTDTDDCSAHYFDVKNGILAQAFYTQGTRFLDVRDPTNIKQIAYYRPDDARTWAAYYHGKYIYVVDHARGIDILKANF
ncbi:LVIVD repeat-containing protein [Spirillospora sp. NPDC048911]|uniref:LVIVD repeat-containing protein n=1 Tax=Spirillospora sp. NPDC048911 TaxID=3364527 RepID=UPI003715D533